MRSSLISLLLVLLAVSASADVFKNQKVKVGKKTCTCSFTLYGAGTKMTSASAGKCDKKCSGTAKSVKMSGDSGDFTFNMKVTRGKVALSNGKFVAAETTSAPSGSGSIPPTGSGSGSMPPSGSGSGSMPPTGSGSGSMPPSGSGSGSMPPTGSGSGSMPPAGSGSGSAPMPPTGEGMQCSCKCDCPDGSGQCDCNCNCPMQSLSMTCALGFTRVCPMTDGSCPQEMEKVCPKGMEETRSVQNREANSPSGCQCVPDFLMSMVMGPKDEPTSRAAAGPDVFKNKQVKVGKKSCKCTFTLIAAGNKLSPKSKATCDKKCSGTAKGLELEGESGNVYTFDMKSVKGKVTLSKGSVELGSVPTEGGSGSGSGLPTPSGPACACVDTGMMGPGEGSGSSSMPGSGSGSMPESGSGSMPGSGSGSMPGSGSGSMPGSGSGSMPGSGSGSMPGSGSGSMPGSGSGSGSGSGVPTPAPTPGPTIPNPGSAAAELTLNIEQTWSQEPSGYTRTAKVTVPATTAGQKVPVVFHLHGNGGQGNTRPVGGWLGDDCVIVAPDGYERSWNVYTEKSKADDVSFILDLIAKIGAEIPAADMSNVNIIGTSNGAALTYRLLIETGADRPFRRAFPMVSSLISPQYHDDQFWKSTVLAADGEANVYDTASVPMFADNFEYAHFHGTEDGALKYEGQSPGPSFLGGADVLAAQKTDYLWAVAMGYTGSQLPDSAGVSIGTTDKPVEEYVYLDGKVRHYKLVGEGHGTGPGHTKVQEIVRAAVLG